MAIGPIKMLSKRENKFWKVVSTSIYMREMIHKYRFQAMVFMFTCDFILGFPKTC